MAHVVVVGAGNVGSHVLPHVARMPEVTRVTVIDRDQYDASNLQTQNISTLDVGKPKADVQAARLMTIDRALDVRAVHAPVEDVPLGWLRGDVILSGVDSRHARMVLNQAAWRLQIPWINAGVDSSGLARVQVFVPANDSACLECAFDRRDYELVEQDYPCQDHAAQPTGAPSALGGLAAALQALECEKLLRADTEHSLAGHDVLIDARHHRHYVTSFGRNSDCRMPDHAGWAIARRQMNASSSLRDFFELSLRGADQSLRLQVAGQQFALTLTCSRCRERFSAGYLYRGKRRRRPEPCPLCGAELVVAGFDLMDRLSLQELPLRLQSRPLADLGILPGDVVTLTTPDVETHLELSGSSWPTGF
jgi:molybdopterin/thiamine biosynthesis adenylyltransferase